MVELQLVVAGLSVVVLAVLGRLAWVTSRRNRRGSITGAQARENAAPLTTAILVPDRRERRGR